MVHTAEHKRKISEGLKKYHNTCSGGKKGQARKQLDIERDKLKKLLQPNGVKNKISDLETKNKKLEEKVKKQQKQLKKVRELKKLK